MYFEQLLFVLQKSEPLIQYMETVSAPSDRVCLAKTGNKHNRIYMTAEPLPDELVDDIDRVRIHTE